MDYTTECGVKAHRAFKTEQSDYANLSKQDQPGPTSDPVF